MWRALENIVAALLLMVSKIQSEKRQDQDSRRSETHCQHTNA